MHTLVVPFGRRLTFVAISTRQNIIYGRTAADALARWASATEADCDYETETSARFLRRSSAFLSFTQNSASRL